MTNINTFQGDVFIHEYIKHTGDDNNLFGFSGTDTFKIATAGADAIKVDASQNVDITGVIRHIGDENNLFGFSGTDTFKIATAGVDRLIINAQGSVTLSTNMFIPDYIHHDGDADAKFGFSGTDTFKIITAGNDRLTVSSAGEVTIPGNALIKSVYRETFTYSGSYNQYKYIGRFSTQANGHVEVTSQGNSQYNTSTFDFQRQYASTPHVSGIDSDHYVTSRWFWKTYSNELYDVWHYIENAGASAGVMRYRIKSHIYSKPSDPSITGRAEFLYGMYQVNKPGYSRVVIGSYSARAGLDVRPTNADSGYGWRIYVATNAGFGDNYQKWFIRNQGNINNTSILATGSIVTQSFLASYSDARIKTDICDVDDNEALDILRLLKPKKYRYIDRTRGSDYVWGFIAQDVSNVLPYSTSTTTHYIPNINNVGTVTDGNVITFSSFNTSNLVSNVTSMKIIDTDGSDKLVKITRVIDEHSIEVDQDVSVLTGALDEYDNVISGNQLFVYGQELDDVLTLNKSSIWTISTAAIQEIDRQLQSEKEKIVNLEARITVLESA